jgi:hypothetical protein
MKLSPIQILFLLILIITLSVYFGTSRRFENELTVSMRGVDTDGSFELGRPAFVPQEEPFVGAKGNATVVPVTSTAYDAMSLKQRADMLKEVQSLVRNELLAARQLDRLKKEVEDEEDEEDEDEEDSYAKQQGRDFHRRCTKSDDSEEYRCPKNPDGSCPPVPDLSNYIRKDQIPCWGCSIDY